MEKRHTKEELKSSFLRTVGGRFNSAELSFEVPAHKMFILKDDGVYRHLRFRRKIDDPCCGFDLITWPGNLTFDGDYGTYQFARVDDMMYFSFANENTNFDDEKLNNLGYWSEKLRAEGMYEDRKTRQYSRDSLEEHVKDGYDNYCHDHPELTTEEKEAIWRKIEEDILGDSDYSSSGPCEFEMRERLRAYEANDDDIPTVLRNTYEWSLSEYTNNYIWACYCIVWGCIQYHQSKKARKISGDGQ